MPEGPEIERMRRRIAPTLAGEEVEVRGILTHKKFLRANYRESVVVRRVERVGKRIGILLTDKRVLMVGAGMTGYWRIQKGDARQPHDLFELVRPDNVRAVYSDTRRFGSATWSTRDEWSADLGIDFTDGRLLHAQHLLQDLFPKNSARPIKPALLDQSKIAGIGNVYASELLWHLRVHPERAIRDFDRWRALGVGTRRILMSAVNGKGVRDGRATVKYQARPTVKGGYTMEVYDQTGCPCSRCETPIESMQQAGRSTYWCPTCQPE